MYHYGVYLDTGQGTATAVSSGDLQLGRLPNVWLCVTGSVVYLAMGSRPLKGREAWPLFLYDYDISLFTRAMLC